MRYECDIAGLESDYIELSDSWSRAEVRAFWAMTSRDGADYGALMRRKLIALHLTCVDAEPLTTVEQFTEDNLEMLDMRAFQWLSFVPVAHVTRLGTLGETTRLRLFGNAGESAAQVNNSPTA